LLTVIECFCWLESCCKSQWWQCSFTVGNLYWVGPRVCARVCFTKKFTKTHHTQHHWFLDSLRTLNTFPTARIIMSTSSVTVDDRFKNMWKEVVTVCFKVLLGHLPGRIFTVWRAEENYKNNRVKSNILWDIMPHGPLKVNRHFGGSLKHTTQCYIPEDINLHNHCFENFKSSSSHDGWSPCWIQS
jgi:hypothetical protein